MSAPNFLSSGLKDIPSRHKIINTVDDWLEDKKTNDGAEGLWRIHNNLYDMTAFVSQHPGGSFWLNITKGSDITELFESYHISTLPEEMVKKYHVRPTKSPRNSPYTFAEDGFYKTLKRRVREALKTIPKRPEKKSKVIMDSLIACSVLLGILALKFWNFKVGFVAGFLLGVTALAGHNYYHMKDNFRMYYNDFIMVNTREWRILHILSHHMYTNTIADMQTYIMEPLTVVMPVQKSKIQKYAALIYTPLVIWPTVFFLLYGTRIFKGIFRSNITKTDALPLVLPLIMYVCSGQTLYKTICMWIFIMSLESFWFFFVGFTGSHYHLKVFIEGDTMREDRDWGTSQLDAVIDRVEVTGSHLLVMLFLGDHGLHHLFPSLDHGLLEHLYPIVEETTKEFNLNMQMSTEKEMIGSFLRQMARDKPNPNPPNLDVGKDLTFEKIVNENYVFSVHNAIIFVMSLIFLSVTSMLIYK